MKSSFFKSPRVELAAFANNLLRKIGFQFVSVKTLQEIVTKNQAITDILAGGSVLSSPPKNMSIEERLSALEANAEQSIQDFVRYSMKAHWRTVDQIEQISRLKPNICQLCGYESALADFREIVSECIFQGGLLHRHECPSCNVIFGPQKMFALDSEMLDLEYRNLYRIYREGDSTESAIRAFHLLKPRNSGIYLDFGCGGGWSSAIGELRSQGFNIYGFEPSASASSRYIFTEWDQLAGFKFDGIYSHNVLEHLFDPIGTTRDLSNLLAGDGRLVHATPCFDYRYEYSRYHVYFFTGQSPEVMAVKAGMRIVEWVRDGDFIACTMQKAVPVF